MVNDIQVRNFSSAAAAALLHPDLRFPRVVELEEVHWTKTLVDNSMAVLRREEPSAPKKSKRVHHWTGHRIRFIAFATRTVLHILRPLAQSDSFELALVFTKSVKGREKVVYEVQG